MTAIRHARTFARVYNTPLLIHPGSLDAMLPALDRALRGDASTPPAIAQRDGAIDDPDADSLLQVSRGVAVIPVHGALTYRGRYDAQCNYLMGYQDFRAALGEAISRDDVEQIVLDIDSPGGEVSGCFDLADNLRLARGIKPIHASINDLGCSAAYALASAAETVSVTRTALAGSIGVVLRHVDLSEWAKAEGYKITHIYAGARKVDGNPYEPLPPAVRNRFQAEIDSLYGLFVATVARNRGLSEQAVIDTEADTFMGGAAVDHGLADHVEPLAQLISRMQTPRMHRVITPETLMANAQTDDPRSALASSPDTAEADVVLLTAADLEAAQAATDRDARRAERARIQQILGAGGGLAAHLAFETDMPAEQAASILAAAAAEPPTATAASALDRHMQAVGDSGVQPAADDSATATVSRAQFDALALHARSAFLAAGGKITETQE